MDYINTLRTQLHKYADYQRTKRELRSMPIDVALDLGLFREDARENARRAVYG